MTTRIPWNDGNGNIVLTFTGHGNGTVTVESDTDNRGIERQQVLTLRTTGSNPVSVQVLVVQLSGQQYLTAQGIQLRTVDGKLLKVAPPADDTTHRTRCKTDNLRGKNVKNTKLNPLKSIKL